MTAIQLFIHLNEEDKPKSSYFTNTLSGRLFIQVAANFLELKSADLKRSVFTVIKTDGTKEVIEAQSTLAQQGVEDGNHIWISFFQNVLEVQSESSIDTQSIADINVENITVHDTALRLHRRLSSDYPNSFTLPELPQVKMHPLSNNRKSFDVIPKIPVLNVNSPLLEEAKNTSDQESSSDSSDSEFTPNENNLENDFNRSPLNTNDKIDPNALNVICPEIQLPFFTPDGKLPPPPNAETTTNRRNSFSSELTVPYFSYGFHFNSQIITPNFNTIPTFTFMGASNNDLKESASQHSNENSNSLIVVKPLIENTDVIAISKNDTNTLYLTTIAPRSENINPTDLIYRTDFTLLQTAEYARTMMNLPFGEYEILFLKRGGEEVWFENGKRIKDYQLGPRTRVCIFPKVFEVDIESPQKGKIRAKIYSRETVGESIRKITTEFDIPYCHSLALFAYKDGQKQPFMDDKTLVQQRLSFNYLILKRAFFIFSSLDLANAERWTKTFSEISYELKTDINLKINDQTALAVTSLIYFLSGSISIPVSYEGEITKEMCEQFLENNRIKHKSTASRLFLQTVQTLPNLGLFKFSVDLFGRSEPLFVNPYSVIFGASFKLAYIINVTKVSNVVDIQYMSTIGKVATLNVVSDQADEIVYFIQKYRRLMFEMYYELSQHEEDPEKDNNIMNITFEAISEYQNEAAVKMDAIDCFRYEKGKDVMRYMANRFENIDQENSILLLETDEGKRWLDLNDFIGMQGIYAGCVIHIFPKMNTSNVSLPYSAGFKVTYSFQTTVNDIIKQIFESANRPLQSGYGIYIDGIVMDPELSLPEQTTYFKQIDVRRRFFPVLKNKNVPSELTYNDCRKYILEHKMNLSDQRVAEIVALSLRIGNQSIMDISDTDIITHIPKDTFVTKNLRQEISKILMKRPTNTTKEQLEIEYKYCVGLIPTFGEVVYQAVVRNMFSKSKKETPSVLKISPLEFLIIKTTESGKAKEISVNYTTINKLEKSVSEITIAFLDSREKDRVFSITSNKKKKIYAHIQANMESHRNYYMERRSEQLDRLNSERNHNEKGEIDVFICSNLSQLASLNTTWVNLNSTQEEISQIVFEKLNFEEKPNEVHKVMMRNPTGETHWLNHGLFGDLKPQKRAILYSLNTKVLASVKNVANASKAMILNLTMPVKDLLKTILQKFGIESSKGFALYQDGKELDLFTSIPEQDSRYDNLQIRRKYFFLPNQLTTITNNLYQLFWDVKDWMFKHQVEFDPKQSAWLAVYDSFVLLNGKVDKKLTVQAIDKYVPPNTVINRKLKKRVKKYILRSLKNKLTINDAIRNYIEIVRSRAQFTNTEVFKHEDISITLSDHSITVENEITKEILFDADYNNILDIQRMGDDMKFVYYRPHENIETFTFNFGMLAQKIEKMIQIFIHYMKVEINELSEEANFENYYEPDERYKCIATFSYSYEYAQGHWFDRRMKVGEALKLILPILKLEESLEVVAFLKYTPNCIRKAEMDVPFGVYFPYDGIEILVCERYKTIDIEYLGKSYKFTVDLSSNVDSIVESIGFRLGVWSSIGYNLFVDDEPLDLCRTIPEQVTPNSTFVLERSYFVATRIDPLLSYPAMGLMKDIKRRLVSGNVPLTPTDAVEFAFYEICATSKDISEVSESYKLTEEQINEVKKMVESRETMEKKEAVTKYNDKAAGLKNFSKVSFLAEFEVLPGKWKQMPLDASNGKLTIQNAAGVSLMVVDFTSLVEIERAVRQVSVRIRNEDGRVTILKMRSDQVEQIYSYLCPIVKFIAPKLLEREKQQSKYAADPFIKFNNSVLVKFQTSPNTEPIQMYVPEGYVGNEVVSLMARGICAKDPDSCRLFAADVESTTRIGEATSIAEFGGVNSRLFLMQIPLPVFVTYKGRRFPASVTIDRTVSEICAEIAASLSLGSSEGLTLYEGGRPLERDIPLIVQTGSVLELDMRRRFFKFSPSFFDDNVSCKALYYDLKDLIISERLKPTSEQQVSLAVLSMYAEGMDVRAVMTDNRLVKNFFPIKSHNDKFIKTTFIRKLKTVNAAISPRKAILSYITTCVSLKDFGAELYKVWNEADGSVCILELNPFSVILHPYGELKQNLLDLRHENISSFMSLDDYGEFEIRFRGTNRFVEKIVFRVLKEKDNEMAKMSITSNDGFPDIADFAQCFKDTSIGESLSGSAPQAWSNNQIYPETLSSSVLVPPPNFDFGGQIAPTEEPFPEEGDHEGAMAVNAYLAAMQRVAEQCGAFYSREDYEKGIEGEFPKRTQFSDFISVGFDPGIVDFQDINEINF